MGKQCNVSDSIDSEQRLLCEQHSDECDGVSDIDDRVFICEWDWLDSGNPM